MKIDRRLNFVIPIDQDDGTTIYVHSAPIGREVFERYYLVIARTFAKIYGGGLGSLAGPRVAALLLKETAMELNVWDGPAGVERGLVAEIRRLSNVLAPKDGGGWETVPLHDAMASGFLDPSDASEVENALVFFTVASAMHRKTELKPVLEGAANFWGGQIESSSCTEFAASLPTSMPAASSGEKAPLSSIPS